MNMKNIKEKHIIFFGPINGHLKDIKDLKKTWGLSNYKLQVLYIFFTSYLLNIFKSKFFYLKNES